MHIRELSPSEHKSFFDLAKNHGSIFVSEPWIKIYGDEVRLCALFGKSDNPIGGFTYFKEKKMGFPYYRNPPFTPNCGLFYENRSSNQANRNSHRKRIISSIADFFKSKKISLINISFPYTETDMQPFLWRSCSLKLRYTYHIDLRKEEKEIIGHFSPERRNDLTKASKDNVVVLRSLDFLDAQKLINQTYEVNRLRNFPEILNQIFSNDVNSFSYVAYHNDLPIACTFVVADSATAYYILGGYNRENRHHGAGALCIWESIKHAKTQGIAKFDFEGSMVPSIESFFRGFGGDIIPFYQVRKFPFL